MSGNFRPLAGYCATPCMPAFWLSRTLQSSLLAARLGEILLCGLNYPVAPGLAGSIVKPPSASPSLMLTIFLCELLGELSNRYEVVLLPLAERCIGRPLCYWFWSPVVMAASLGLVLRLRCCQPMAASSIFWYSLRSGKSDVLCFIIFSTCSS